MDSSDDIVITPEAQRALDLFEEGKNILLTGEAGTGKTTITRIIIEKRSEYILQCGTTGVSALLLPNGRTIHSALKIPVGSFPDTRELRRYYLKLYHSCQNAIFLSKEEGATKNTKRDHMVEWFEEITKSQILLIDEVSMLSAWMLMAIDIALRVLRNAHYSPLGGMQVVLVGDFLQLPPVYDRHDKEVPVKQGCMAFESSVWTALDIQKIMLTKIFRQRDAKFASFLNTIRKGRSLVGQNLEFLQEMCKRPIPDNALHIMFRKKDVREVNVSKLKELKQKGKETMSYSFPIWQMHSISTEGKEESEQLLKMIRDTLHLDYRDTHQEFIEGQRVMLTRNLHIGKDNTFYRLVNGDVGTILYFGGWKNPPKKCADRYCSILADNPLDKSYPVIQWDDRPGLPSSFKCQIVPYGWERKRVERKSGELITVAEVDSIPLITAFSLTAHKCQGKTIGITPIHINADCMNWSDSTFYVAISRAQNADQVSITNFKGFKQPRKGEGYYMNMIALPEAEKYDPTKQNEDLMREEFPEMFPVNHNTHKETSAETSTETSTDAPSIKRRRLDGDEKENLFNDPVETKLWIHNQLKNIPKTPDNIHSQYQKFVKPILNECATYFKGVCNSAKRRRTDEFIYCIQEWIKDAKNTSHK